MRFFICFLFLSCAPGLFAQEGDVTQATPWDFTVPTDGLYTFEVPGGSNQHILALWKKEPGGRSLVARNLDSTGKPLVRWQARLTAGSPYQLSLQAGPPGVKVRWGLLLSGPLSQPLPPPPPSPAPGTSGPTSLAEPASPGPVLTTPAPLPPLPSSPPPVDYGEWKKIASLTLTETPTDVRVVSGFPGFLLGIMTGRKFQVWTLDQGSWIPLGPEKDAGTWNSWDVGWEGSTPVLVTALLAQPQLPAELRVERWNGETWQITPVPGANGGTVSLVALEKSLGLGAWDLSSLPRWKFWNLGKTEVYPSPALGTPVSALYSLAPFPGGPWAGFQMAEGRERWYEVFRFDGTLWSSLDFPRIKNVRGLLLNPGRSGIIGVIDGTGRPQLYQKDKEFWTALPSPEGLVIDPRGKARLAETEAGLYLLSASGDHLVWHRRKEGVWTTSPPLSRMTFWDHWSNDLSAGVVVQTQGNPGVLEILQLP